MNNIKDLFVSYEIANQLKIKGFNETCISSYTWDGIRITHDTLTSIGKPIKNSDTDKYTCSASLYQQVVDWLREKHEIFILVLTSSGNKEYGGRIETIDCNVTIVKGGTYYEALTKAIEEALKLI